MNPVDRIDHLVINVADAEQSADWYVKLLGMRHEVVVEGRAVLWFGKSKLHVRPISQTQDEWFTADQPQPGSDDLCFITTSEIDEVARHLKSLGVPIEKGPVPRAGALGEMLSVYCRDPDGSLIEISSYGGR